MRKLLDFDVAIEPGHGGYRTRVLASPAGEWGSVDFALPFTDVDLENFVLKVGMSIGRVRRKLRRIESQERRLIEDFGGQLFRAVFSGPLRECLEQSRLVAESKGAGLRIRLRLPAELGNVPWEYLYDEDNGGFIGLFPDIALVRYPEMPRPVRPLPVSPPLRILAMISAPSDLAGLSGEDEWDKLNDALSDLAARGMVQVDRLEIGTLTALQPVLRRHDYHVLHFVGHGYYDQEAGDGALALEGADGKTRLVTGRDLGLMLRGHRSLRLVVLNACEGARSARDDPFGGVAQALVRQGIPAVIAMQFEISDPAAVAFGHSFYQGIADGLPVDLAMVEARRAMWAEGHEVEWATPVLNLRSPDGRIFTRTRMTGASHPAQEKAGSSAQKPDRPAQKPDRPAQKAGRPARERAGRPAGKSADRPARQEADDPARQEADRKARADAARQARAERRAEEKRDFRGRKTRAVSIGHAGDPARARDLLAKLRLDREQTTRALDPLALDIRSELAEWTGRAGDPAAARDQFAELVPICERVLGPNAIDTVGDLGKLAYWSGQAGDAAAARDQYAKLASVLESVLGPSHWRTLDARSAFASWTGEAGDAAGARDEFAAVLPVYERTLGPEHGRTVSAQKNLTYWTQQSQAQSKGVRRRR
jgi:CHAT domain